MKVYLVCHQREPCCPTDLGPASRFWGVAAKALHDEFAALVAPDRVIDQHGYEVTFKKGFVTSFRDIEGSGPSGHIEELEVEDE